MRQSKFSKRICFLTAFICLAALITPAFAITAGPVDQGSSFSLSREEQAYLSDYPTIEVVVVSGNAPVAYLENGKLEGILHQVLKVVSHRTGLTFRCTEVSSYTQAQEAVRSGSAHIIGGIPIVLMEEAYQHYPRSEPILSAQMVLLMHTGVDIGNLSHYTYAAVEGSRLPQGTKAVRYYNSRSEVLDAVNRGESDYCYFNEYSLAFYAQKKQYSNLIIVPGNQGDVSYHLVYTQLDPRVISAVNQSIQEISPLELQRITLTEAARVGRDRTVELLLRSYGAEIALIAALTVLILTLMLLLIWQSRKQYRRSNRQYRMLADLSDEYVYEYDARKDLLILSDEISSLLDIPKRIENLKGGPRHPEHQKLVELVRTDRAGDEITFPLRDGRVGEFRMINSVMRDRNHRDEYIIGKLINIQREKKRVEALLAEAQIDGLTGLYNPDTTRRMIEGACEAAAGTAALFVVDVDEFKSVNDTYGHLAGDKTLAGVASFLRDTFRETDIVGRLGGDEFCILLLGPVAEEIIRGKCRQLLQRPFASGEAILITLSIGVSVCQLPTTFEALYDQADRALYQVKNSGRNGYAIHGLPVSLQE